MNKTKIEWCDYTWNPITGCSNTCSYCYAREIAHWFGWSFAPTYHQDRLYQPLIKQPSVIFVSSMGEFFDPAITDPTRRACLAVMGAAPQHKFVILTKRPDEIRDLNYSDNVWIGVSVETQKEVWRLEALAELPYVPHKVACFEPLLGDINWRLYPQAPLFGFQWVIIGGQTNPRRPPKPQWIFTILAECECWGIPVFIKPNAEFSIISREWPWPGEAHGVQSTSSAVKDTEKEADHDTG